MMFWNSQACQGLWQALMALNNRSPRRWRWRPSTMGRQPRVGWCPRWRQGKSRLGEDETFHPAICRVGIEPVSDFIVLEADAEKRDAKTWNAAVSKALAGLPVEVIQSTSDEGQGLLAHVREGLGAHPSPDLFHRQRPLCQHRSPLVLKQ